MKEELSLYLESLTNVNPQYVYEGLLSVFCIGFVLLFVFKKKIVWRGITGLLLIEYIFLIYCSTVFFRIVREERKFDYTPFWSYDRSDLMAENIMNVVVFVPVGLLLGIAFKDIRWWKVLLTGAFISISIEVLQFILKKGFSELDDVMHNTLGCMIGYWIYALARYGYERIIRVHG